jgi:hypothetical protein
MAVYCKNCGTQNTDPGILADLGTYRCGRCGQSTLYRVSEPLTPKEKTLVGTILGAGIGGAIGGPPGAVIGGAIGALISGSKPPVKQ